MCICGDSKCRGLCDLNIGRKMYAFYKQIENNIRDSKIGSTQIDSAGSGRYLYVKGYEFYNPVECKRSDDFSHIYTMTPMTTVVENVFDSNAGEIGRYADAYSQYKGLTIQEAIKFKNDMQKLARRDKIIIPANFGEEYSIYVYPDGKPKVRYKSKGKLEKIKWAVNKDTNRIECLLRFKIDSKVSKEVNIEKYGVEYFDNNISTVGGTDAEKVIKMSSFGYIKPLLVENANGILVVDNLGVYYGTLSYNIREIGYWEDNTLNLISTEIDKQLLEFLKKYKSCLAMNRKRMAPYYVGVPNEVKL